MAYDTVTVTMTFGPWSVGIAQDVASNGKPTVRIFKTGDPNYVIGGAPAPTLQDLTIANNIFVKGISRTASFLNATALSTITASGLPSGMTIDNVNHQLLWDGSSGPGSGNITPTETLAGATNTPHISPAIAYTINSVPAFTVSPSVTGTPSVGTLLTGADGTYTGTPTPTVSARRMKLDGTTVGTTTYTPVSGDVGKVITYEVDISNGYGGTITGISGNYTVVAAGAALDAPTVVFAPSHFSGQNPPDFTITVPAANDPITGDYMVRQYRPGGGGTVVEEYHLITDADIASGDWAHFTYAVRPAAGSRDFRFAYARPTTPGVPGTWTIAPTNWSAWLNDTLAAPTALSVISCATNPAGAATNSYSQAFDFVAGDWPFFWIYHGGAGSSTLNALPQLDGVDCTLVGSTPDTSLQLYAGPAVVATTGNKTFTASWIQFAANKVNGFGVRGCINPTATFVSSVDPSGSNIASPWTIPGSFAGMVANEDIGLVAGEGSFNSATGLALTNGTLDLTGLVEIIAAHTTTNGTIQFTGTGGSKTFGGIAVQIHAT